MERENVSGVVALFNSAQRIERWARLEQEDHLVTDFRRTQELTRKVPPPFVLKGGPRVKEEDIQDRKHTCTNNDTRPIWAAGVLIPLTTNLTLLNLF